jgi:two-component system CheB/CheR fusion protein
VERTSRSLLIRYLIALVSVAAVPFVLLLLHGVRGAPQLFLAAVMVSAWYGGLGPGLFATILSALLLDFLIPPARSLGTGIESGLRLSIFVLVAILISSLNAARMRLDQALRAQDRRKDEFLSVLAHELRSPLSALGNALHILRCSWNDRTAVDQSRALMERQVRYMTRLVQDLMDVARITQGKLQLHKEQIDLAELVENAVEMARPLMEDRGHRLKVVLPEAKVCLEGDATRLEQVIVNLLANAAKYTEREGSVWLTCEKGVGQVVLRVRDNGAGMPPELVSKVFELYVQADNGSRGGLGIGLNLVRRLVELHGGTVTASSAGPGRGSEFIARLPLPPGPMQACGPVGAAAHLRA